MTAGPIVNLEGKKALVTGIANQRSIAWGIAQALKSAGAEIGVSYLPVSEKSEGKVRKTSRVRSELRSKLLTQLYTLMIKFAGQRFDGTARAHVVPSL